MKSRSKHVADSEGHRHVHEVGCDDYALLAGETPRAPATYRDDVVQQRLLYGDLKWLAEQLDDGNPGAFGAFLHSLATTDQVFVRPDDPKTTVAALRRTVELGVDAVRATLSVAHLRDELGAESVRDIPSARAIREGIAALFSGRR